MKTVFALTAVAIVMAFASAEPLNPCEFVCPYSLIPVCGSDGFTYPSECDLKRVDCVRRGVVPLTVAYTGRCKCDEVACSKSLLPACSSEGVTYPSDCALRQTACREEREITIAHMGECESK
ncbi:turripeptide Ici9.2-like [Liolophura sinensis]|uniref:turripeptide Ici9.2-like n=1 Tax=Liolophura sinensis TaxID=3198878 RepID=UPI0031587F62